MMKSHSTPHRHNAGFTLLEVMVAATITALLGALVMSIFLSTSQTQRATQAVVNNHETARTLTQVLNQDLNSTRITSISSSNQIAKPSGVTYGGILQTATGNITYRLNEQAQLTRTNETGDTRIVASQVESILFTGNQEAQLINIRINMLDSPFNFTVTKRVVNQ